MSSSKQTHNHETIKEWTENHDGVPAVVSDTSKGEQGGILRIHFPKHSSDNSELKQVDWDTFFKTFDENNLDFLYQDTKTDDEENTFHKFVERT